MFVIIFGLPSSTHSKTIDTLTRAIEKACSGQRGREILQGFDPAKLAIHFPLCLIGTDVVTKHVTVYVAPSSPDEVFLRSDMSALARHIGETIKETLPGKTVVRCHARRPNHHTHGSWSSVI